MEGINNMYPTKLNPDKCKEVVNTPGMRGFHYHQCMLPVVKDGYCRLHHPDAVKAREEAVRKRHEENFANSPYMRLADLHDRMSKLITAVEGVLDYLPKNKSASELKTALKNAKPIKVLIKRKPKP